MFQLAYVSSARVAFSTEHLNTLLQVARRRNDAHEVTGFLLHRGSSFFQVLEGSEAKVEFIFSLIASDARHFDIKILFRRYTAKREFKRWSMAYVNESALQNVSLYDAGPSFTAEALTNPPSPARRHLRLFAKGLYQQLHDVEVDAFKTKEEAPRPQTKDWQKETSRTGNFRT